MHPAGLHITLRFFGDLDSGVTLGVVGTAMAVEALTGGLNPAYPYTISLAGNHAAKAPHSAADVVTLTIHANQAQPSLQCGLVDWSRSPYFFGGLSVLTQPTDVQITSVSGSDCRLDANAIACAIPAGGTTSVTVTFPTDNQGREASLVQGPNADAVVDWTEAQLG